MRLDVGPPVLMGDGIPFTPGAWIGMRVDTT